MRLKDNKIIILLIFLTSSILIFGFNYLYGNNRKPSPYFMSDKFIAFESNNNNHSLDFLNMNENISVAAFCLIFVLNGFAINTFSVVAFIYMILCILILEIVMYLILKKSDLIDLIGD